MSDILDLYNQSIGASKNPEAPAAQDPSKTNPYPSTEDQIAYDEGLRGNATPEDNKGAIPDNIPGTPEEQAQSENAYMSDVMLGKNAGSQKDIQAAPDTWGPEYTARGFIEEAGTSIMRGVGKHLVKGTGDLIQVAGAIAGLDPKGNWVTNLLQQSGEEMSEEWRSFIPEELQHENLGFSALANPKFWSTHVAEMIPQLAEFILLSKGGSSVAKAGAKKLLKNSDNVLGKSMGTTMGKANGEIAGIGKNVQEAMGTGSGLMGKLSTDVGLTAMGNNVFGALGGGIAGNVFSGMLNAAQVINENKDSGVYSDEELAALASSTMRNNSAWLAIDIASWGFTYGGLGKMFKGIGGGAKGASSAKVGKELFKYDVAPILKGIGRVSGKAGMEAVEETFQETFEEWSAKKAMADQTGYFSDGLADVPGFMDFYRSKENRGTLVLSAALGGLGGGVFNIDKLVDQKAKEAHQLQTRIERFEATKNRQGSEADILQMEHDVFQQVADMVIDDKVGLYEDFSNKLVENGNLNEEKKAELDLLLQDMIEVKAKAKKLNVRGVNALLYHKAKQNLYERGLNKLVEESQEKIDTYRAIAEKYPEDASKAKEVAKKIQEEESIFKQLHGALTIKLAHSMQNQENLILGKKAEADNAVITLDKYGNEIIMEGLSTEDYKKYVEKEGKNPNFKDKLKKKFTMPSTNGLGRGARDFVAKAKDIYSIFKEETPVYDEDGNQINKKEEVKPEDAQEASGETFVNGEKVQTPKTEQEAQEEAETLYEQSEKIFDDEASESAPEVDEVIDEESWTDFEENSTVIQGTIDDIAANIHQGLPLSNRQEQIRGKNRGRIKEAIAKRILRTTDVSDAGRAKALQSEEAGEIARKQIEDDKIREKRDRFRDGLGNLKRKIKETKAAWRKRVKKDIKQAEEDFGRPFTKEEIIMIEDGTLDAEFEVMEDNDPLSENEAEFVESEVMNAPTGKPMKRAFHEKMKRAVKKYGPKKKDGIDEAEIIDEVFGKDKRDGSIAAQNIAEAQALENMFRKMRRRKIKDGPRVSQNELDNYLNRISTFNEFGPTELDKMQMVNHQLKNMFPNMKYPTQVYIIDNLYHSLGSVGLGHALAGTIFIDAKAWNQDNVFMHELSHVYFQLSKDEPEVQKLIDDILKKDRDLIRKVKQLYPDYVLYDVKAEDEAGNITYKRRRKGQIMNAMRGRKGGQANVVEGMFQKMINDGEIKAVPLREQMDIIEEAFVTKLEGPLAAKYDKVFQPKNEPKRQEDVKMFWGMLRKKGAIIQENDGVDQMLGKLYEDGVPSGDLKAHIFKVFSSVTAGQSLNYSGMDKRAEAYTQDIIDSHKAIDEELKAERKLGPPNISLAKEEKISLADALDDHSSELEEQGNAFYNKDHDSKAKGAAKIMRRFGSVYNKALRKRHIKDANGKAVNWKMAPVFDRDIFESTIYSLATENPNMKEFIRQINESSLEEVQAFKRYLEKVHPNSKNQILAGMHLVFGNAKHIVGFRNTMDGDRHWMQDSLSLREQNKVDDILSKMAEGYGKGKKHTGRMNNFITAVNEIYNGSTDKKHFQDFIMGVSDYSMNLDKIMEQGYLTFQGVNIPIDTLIKGYVKKGYIFQRKSAGSNERITGKINVYEARGFIEALVNTNRKFTPSSMVQNAEGNYEPVRITNNHLTKEVDEMVDFLYELKENPTMENLEQQKEAFLNRFSHIGHKNRKYVGKAYQPNMFLVQVFDDFQKGILPQISQYHGLMDSSNSRGSLYKTSTALEQGIEDMMIYANSSRTENGRKKKWFLANLGSFSDSPRKFFMNMKRVDYKEIFEADGKSFKKDGEVINSLYHIFKETSPDSKFAKSKQAFKAGLKDAMREELRFMNDNGPEISKIPQMQRYYEKKGGRKLTQEGKEMVMEYVINSAIAGANVSDVFLPGITDGDVIKRMKANSSPIFSVRNENFRMEPLFFADELINGKESGTDSGMYILREDATKLQNLGRGIFEMNEGFKLLNSHIEKDNEKFSGKMAYLKGFTTIVDKGHPLYDAMKARKDKYNAYHLEKYGKAPSADLNDGTHNHMVIAVPQSSDKSGFMPEKYHEKGKYTEKGLRMSPAHIKNNLEEVNKDQDNLFYKNGEFIGLSTYNFGPQQVMDKETKVANTPVQLENNIIVGALSQVNLALAEEIQQHISDQKQKNLKFVLDKIKDMNADQYKKLIMKSLNREDMDQAQRLLLEDGGSLSHPMINEIVVNQLAKTLRREGNKLMTPGTNAHQKPDIGYEAMGAKVGTRLKGYQPNGNGSLKPMEIILGNHMASNPNAKARKDYTWATHKDMMPKDISPEKAMQSLKNRAFEEATFRAKKYPGVTPESLITEVRNEFGDLQGYQVRGDLVIATRVPSSKPGDTGVFEIVGFDQTSDGNQVMVPSEFNEITGADNDGDSLFIQTQGDADFADWNKAFNKITNYWLSKDMAEQVQSVMDFVDETKEMIETEFSNENEKFLQFSPAARRVDYNNTMVSQRNISPIFSAHKITNMLAAYKIGFGKAVKLNGREINNFEDYGKGKESRNQRSAVLANIVLDNAKHGFADALGLDEHNISHAVLMINMGFSLKDVGKILNSDAAKEWSSQNRKNNSLYHDGVRKSQVVNAIYSKLGLGKKRRDYKSFTFSSNSDLNSKFNQAQIVEFMSYLSDMNAEIQTVSSVMSGHNKIHVNPLVLEKQLKQYDDLMTGKVENGILNFSEEFRHNPNLKNYVLVARATLKHTQTLNPVYRNATNKVIKAIESKMGRELTPKQIEEITRSIQRFNTSRLIGFNNNNKEYAQKLLDKNYKKNKNEDSIFYKMDLYVNELRKNVLSTTGKNTVTDNINAFHNSILLNKALNFNLSGNNPYISMNPEFVNDSFTKEERERAQREFEEMPTALQDDLMLYDLIQKGWAGKTSMASIFGREANFMINMAADNDLDQKQNIEIPENVTRELERVIALRESQKQSNAFIKVFPKVNEETGKMESSLDAILNNPEVDKHFNKYATPLYVIVNRGGKKLLFEMDPFTEGEAAVINSDISKEVRMDRMKEIVRDNKKFKHIKNDLIGDGSIDIALINDDSIDFHFKSFGNRDNNEALNPLVEATISYEEAMERVRNLQEGDMVGKDAREEYDIELFRKVEPLTQQQFEQAMEFDGYVSASIRTSAYEQYLKDKEAANNESEKALKDLEKKSEEQLLSMYQEYGTKNVYAYSIIITPVLLELASRMANGQAKLWSDNNVQGKGFDGQDVSKVQAYLMGGSTIPSNHPTSQYMARIVETEYKKFIGEKTKRISEMNRITEALYKKKLGYGTSGWLNKLRALRDTFLLNRSDVYQSLYGALVIREEKKDPKTGKITHDFRLKPVAEVNKLFEAGQISKEEKDFYDFFKKTTAELMPEKIKGNKKADYIPHTAMNKFEAFSSRGLLGLMLNSRPDSEVVYDVKMYFEENGEKKLLNFKEIEDIFKGSAAGNGKNDIRRIAEYRQLRHKAEKLLKTGKNEDGSDIRTSGNMIETALGFGAMNRFTNNRSIRATEMPSMDLNKALGDYIHSTLFVNGGGDFRGMEKLQGYIDAALAFNRESNVPNMNEHVQKVWKDYFVKGERQVSFLGKKGDAVVRGLTRLNLFYALGYQANKNTGGLYAIGNILVGKYHNIKDIGAGAWIRGEAKFWGLDKGLDGGLDGIHSRHKRMMRIMKNLNFMDINIYDEINIEKSNGLNNIFSKLALSPMIISENWIQKVHMIGLLTDEELERFDENGEYKAGMPKIEESRLVELEDQVKGQHGRGYQPTDQRAIQMYSWGNMIMQFSKFIPTMVNDRFAKKDVNSYGQEHIGSLRQAADVVRYALTDPKGFKDYYAKMNDYEKKRFHSAMKGMAMSAVIGIGGAALASNTLNDLYGDANYYLNHEKLGNKMVPPAIQSTNNFISELF